MTVGGSAWFVCLVFANNIMSWKFVDSYPKNTSQTNSTAFVGAVVNLEPPWTRGSPKMAAVMNAASFGKFAVQAAAAGAEVVVFPEGALRSLSGERFPVDIPPLGSNMCDSVSFPDQIIALLSCAAYSASLYLVASVDENVGDNVCSAQVVLDEDGTLIARHREYECGDDEDEDDDDQYFTLQPAGVKIGLLLTHDLVETGIVNDLVSEGVVHYALSYSNKESSRLDASLQTQLWWSFGRNVILMASGLTSNAEQDRRSGIYGGRSNGRCLPEIGGQGLVVADVPSKTGTSPHCRDADWGAERIHSGPKRRALRDQKMTSNLFEPENGQRSLQKIGIVANPKHSEDYDDYYDDFLENEKVTMYPVTHDMSGKWTKLCQYKFCCSFYVETTPIKDHPGYRLMVFSGPSLEFGPNVRVDRCGLVQCHHCEGNEIVTFMVQSNRPGLTPNILTDGHSPSPRIRFSDSAHPRMIADQNVRSVVSAVLQTAEKEGPDDESGSDPGDDGTETPIETATPSSTATSVEKTTTDQSPQLTKPHEERTTKKYSSPFGRIQEMQDSIQHSIESLQHDINDNFNFGIGRGG